MEETLRAVHVTVLLALIIWLVAWHPHTLVAIGASGLTAAGAYRLCTWLLSAREPTVLRAPVTQFAQSPFALF
jgi:hypothetical protein